MLSQLEADSYVKEAKKAVRNEVLSWKASTRYDEQVISIGEPNILFLLTLTRNPFEIKAHLRTKTHNVPLARIDSFQQHFNPDGSKVTGPHLHLFREGYCQLQWAEEIDWYDTNKPLETIYRFLEIIQTRFPKGIQVDWL